MKRKIIAIVVLGLSLASCQTNESKAKSLVEEYLSKTLNDYDSYQSVEWSSLDSVFSPFLASEEGQNTLERFQSFLRLYEDAKNGEGDIFHRRIDYLDSAGIYKRKLDSLEAAFVPEHIGWQITHTYRAKNLNGAYRLAKDIFYFSMDLDSVMGTEDLED